MGKVFYMRDFEAYMVGMFSIIVAYFDTTFMFIIALLIGFSFNILAGFRADEVKFEMRRLANFEGNKLKDSLMELGLITGTTYVLKLIMDLMSYDAKSVYVVQILIALANYYYFRNALRNLSKAYPKSKWIKTLYILVSFQFKELMPDSVNRAVEQVEKETENAESTTKNY